MALSNLSPKVACFLDEAVGLMPWDSHANVFSSKKSVNKQVGFTETYACFPANQLDEAHAVHPTTPSS